MSPNQELTTLKVGHNKESQKMMGDKIKTAGHLVADVNVSDIGIDGISLNWALAAASNS